MTYGNLEEETWDSSLNIASLQLDYRAGIKPQQVLEAIYERIEAYKEVQPSVWIYIRPLESVLRAAEELFTLWPEETTRPPLWGIPFSVKDSIDIVDIPTTLACPALAYIPTASAAVYRRCIEAGGLFIGKTNLEQLATGITGCRSPFGTLHSTFSKNHIVGGSTSGGAVSVSEGLVSFALGSDTAGSIRVPALYNGVVGLKPTKGTVSARGLFPACLHQDCASFLALTTEDAETVWRLCKGFDKQDVFSRRLSPEKPRKFQSSTFRFGVPPEAVLATCSPIYRQQFGQVTKTLQEAGGSLINLDWAPFAGANDLLYSSTFLLERLTVLPEGWFEKNKQLLLPVIRETFEGAIRRQSTAMDVFRDLHKQAEYRREVENFLYADHSTGDGEELTVVVVPTAPFHATIDEVSGDPVGINARLGIFSWFANVLDLVGLAVPCGSYEVETECQSSRPQRLPFGVTFLASSGLDEGLFALCKRLEGVLGDIA